MNQLHNSGSLPGRITFPSLRNALACAALSLSLTIPAFAKPSPREITNFDFDWLFSLSDNAAYSSPDTPSGNWEAIQLPHDWNITQTFNPQGDGSAAFLPDGIGWYRKQFSMPASAKGKKTRIIFDGIFQNSDVFINGHHLGHRPYGFGEIEYDLSPYLNFDKPNLLAVRVNTTGGRPRWYSGAGIYRHARLVTTDPVAVANHGTYVTTPEISPEQAIVKAAVSVENASAKPAKVEIVNKIKDASGKVVATVSSEKKEIAAGATQDFSTSLSIPSPMLWSPDSPTLYSMETTVKSNGKTTDAYSTPFGVRSAVFDPEKGFVLNGERVKLKGLCLHQDAGSLGVALPLRSMERKLEILKEYGCNAIRCAHNQPAPEFLDLCDSMGFLVIDEGLDKWKSGYYEGLYDEWWRHDLKNMIVRDRNHPSIILWSIGNEVTEAWDGGDTGVERARMMQDYAKNLEPTRPITFACQNNHQSKFCDVAEVKGYNYLEARMLSDKKRDPQRIVFVSEELPYYRGEEGRIRSYTPLNPWQLVAENDFVAGGFIWSGVDYLGEAGWPSKGWPTGLFDVCCFEKPRAAYHRAMWNPEPMVDIAVADPSLDIDHGRDLWQWPNMASHWNFPPSYEGLVMEVRTTTNCDSVEMAMNGNVMGRHATADFTNNTIVWNIPYTPGTLEARGFKDGKLVASRVIKTSGKAAKMKLTADRGNLSADGQDLSHIAIELFDEEGNPVQTDDRLVSVTVSGAGRLLGLDSGDLRRDGAFFKPRHNPDGSISAALPSYFGKALAVVQAGREAGDVIVTVEAEGIPAETLQISSK